MKEIDVVDRALKKAKQNGWQEFKSQYERVFKQHNHLMVELLVGVDLPPLLVSYEQIVFSPLFAEAFWGLDSWYFVVHIDQAPGMDNSVVGWKSEEELARSGQDWKYYDNVPAYEYHLQQLALEESQEDRVAYLEKYL